MSFCKLKGTGAPDFFVFGILASQRQSMKLQQNSKSLLGLSLGTRKSCLMKKGVKNLAGLSFNLIFFVFALLMQLRKFSLQTSSVSDSDSVSAVSQTALVRQ
jgi:hypothetical protein